MAGNRDDNPTDPNKTPNSPVTEDLKTGIKGQIDSIEKALTDKLGGPIGGMVNEKLKDLDGLEEQIAEKLANSSVGGTALEALKKVSATIKDKIAGTSSTVQSKDPLNKDPFDRTPRLRDDDDTPKPR